MCSQALARAALAGCLVPVCGVAQDSATLDPLVVTPTLTTRTVDESLSSVTVVDRDELDRQQPRQMSSVLRGRPGVDISTNGSFGKNTSVFTRGTGSESTVLLIDGIRIRSATTGGAPWQFIPPQLIDRLEIVRGPRSSLYGADAVGGVVQAFTPDGRDGGQQWLEAGGGSHDTGQVGGGIAGSNGDTSYSVAGNHFDTDGEPVRSGGEDKGYRNTSGIGRVSHRFDNGAEITALGMRATGNTEFDGGDTDFRIQTLGARATLPLTANTEASLQVSESRDEQTTRQGGSPSVFDTRTRTVRATTRKIGSFGEVIVGGEFRDDDVYVKTDFIDQLNEESRHNAAAFGQALLDLDPTELQLSLRFDDNEAFGDRVTGGAAIGHTLDTNHRIRLSYGTAFRAPSFNDLFTPDLGFFRGNPSLKPETSETIELGLRGEYERFYWDTVAFQTEIDDLIQGLPQRENLNQARIRGVEVATGWEPGPWDVSASATLIQPEQRSGENKGNRLARRATESLRVDVDRKLGDFSVGGSLIAQGDRYNSADNDVALPGYGLLNLRAGWSPAPRWSARLTVDNVLDKDFVTARSPDEFDYQNAGRTAFLSIRYGSR